MEEKVKEAIDAIRPALQNDGGDIEFVKMEGNDVYVKLVGACAGCPMSQLTLSNGVQRYVRETVDQNLNIINATFLFTYPALTKLDIFFNVSRETFTT